MLPKRALLRVGLAANEPVVDRDDGQRPHDTDQDLSSHLPLQSPKKQSGQADHVLVPAPPSAVRLAVSTRTVGRESPRVKTPGATSAARNAAASAALPSRGLRRGGKRDANKNFFRKKVFERVSRPKRADICMSLQ